MSDLPTANTKNKKKQKRDGRRFCTICGDIYEDDEKLSTFVIRKEWIRLVPALQKNLSDTSRICSQHFEEADIKKGRIIQDIYYPYLKWSLVKNAVPKFFLDCQTNKANKPTNENLSSKQKQSVKTSTTVEKKRPQPMECYGSKKQKLQTCSPNIPVSTSQSSSRVATSLSSSQRIENNASGGAVSDGIEVVDITGSSGASIPTDSSDLPNATLPVSSETTSTETASTTTVTVTNSTVALQPHVSSPINRPSTLLQSSNNVDNNFGIFICHVKLPFKTWRWDVSNQSCYNLSYSFDEVTTKIVRIDLNGKKVSFFVNSKRISPTNLKFDFSSPAELEEILRDFHSRKVCNGIVDFSTLNSNLVDQLKENGKGTIHSERCSGFSESKRKMCSSCHDYKVGLERLTKKASSRKEKMKNFKIKLQTAQRKIRRLQSRTTKKEQHLEVENKDLKATISKLKITELDNQIRYLTPLEKIVIKTFIEKEKVEDKSGPNAMKYDKEFMKECMLLKKKSVAAYKHIKARKLLPLPSVATVQKLINSEEKGKANETSVEPSNPPPDNTADNAVDETVTEFVIEISPEAEAMLNSSCISTGVATPIIVATG